MNKQSYPVVCHWCKEPFQGYRPNSKFCCSAHRYLNTAATMSDARKAKRLERQKKWGVDNWQRKREYMLRYTYGISPEQYETLLVKQNYSCAVCKRHESEFNKKLAVEHNHQTKEIQGLCCMDCNRNVIGKRRNPGLFLNAYKYLSSPGTGWFVPEKKRRPRRKHKR